MLFPAALMLIVLILLPGKAMAADNVTQLNLNTVWILLSAVLVFFMQAGFALIESGMSRAKNAVNVMMKNYMDVCLGSILFWMVGYGLMFGVNPSGLFGSSHFALTNATAENYTFLLFQIMFAATAVTICSGAMAERTRYDAYLIAACGITAFIYPVFGSWVWGGHHGGSGWLGELGFIDFAGSTVVHSVGAWCALAGIIVLGPRTGRFDRRSGEVRNVPGHNLSLVALGGFILWFGWFGFNGGSSLVADESVGLILLNTQLAAAAGATGAVLFSRFTRQPVLLTATVNGSLAGLVGITAGCATMTPEFSVLTGFVAGVISVLGQSLLLRLQLDDVVSAVPVHGFAGVWGTLAAGMFVTGDLFNTSQMMVQMMGIISAFFWAFPLSLLLFWVIRRTNGLRADPQHEQRGLDFTEHEEIGYPEFHQNPTYHHNS